MTSVLVVDDSAVDRRLVGGLLTKRFGEAIQFAANGVEALALLKKELPDLIVTDLTMPVMDGLELVRCLRNEHPEIPVILMTAYGSEMLALEALNKGAASYVPKLQLADRLLGTVDEVLALARADRYHAQLLDCLGKTEFNFVLPANPALVDPLVDLVQQMVTGMHLTDMTGRLQIGVALRHALVNALFHGCLELSEDHVTAVQDQLLIDENEVSVVDQRRGQTPYCDRRIHVDVRLTPEEGRFVVRDEGAGFDVSAFPGVTGRGAVALEKGRGLSLMRTFMDEVAFNPLGNEVTMIKRREQK